MNKPVKRALIFFAMLSLMLSATWVYATDDWNLDFDIGVDVSGYDSGRKEAQGFSHLKVFFGLAGKQQISERLSIIEGLHYKAVNIEKKTATVRDTNVFEAQLGLEYVLTPWPPPPLKWLPSRLPYWLPSLPNLREQTHVYFKLTGSYLFAEDDWIDQEHFNTTFLGIGLRYDNPSSKMNESYVEIGTGSSERFDSSWRYLKSNITFFYKMSEVKSGWKAFLSTQLDVGSGDDDLRVGIGFSRDARFIADLLKGFAGSK